MSADDVLTRAAMLTTSDFTALVGGSANKVLQAAYQAAQSPLKSLARQTTHPDFKGRTLVKLGETSALQRVTESGEIKSITRGEASESYAIDTFAGIISYSRKLQINDDLSALADTTRALGAAAAEKEANLLVALLLEGGQTGPLMSDGNRLFSAAHGNLATSAGPIGDAGKLAAARLAMRKQKGLDGTTPIGVAPKFVLVDPELEEAAEQMLTAQTYPVDPSDANVFHNRLTLLVEPRLPADGWYVFADPAIHPVLEFAYLQAAQGPQISSQPGWNVLGIEFRVVLDFGCGAVDFRGAYYNAG